MISNLILIPFNKVTDTELTPQSLEESTSQFDAQSQIIEDFDEVADRLSKMKDIDFLSSLLDQLILYQDDKSKIKRLLNHPALSKKLYSLSTDLFELPQQTRTRRKINPLISLEDNVSKSLNHLLNFVVKHPSLLRNKQISGFIASNLSKLHAFIVINSACGQNLCFSGETNKIQEILYSSLTPKSFIEPLKGILSYLKEDYGYFENYSLACLFNVNNTVPSPQIENNSREILRQAINVANRVDGGDFRSYGIRLRIHQAKSWDGAGKLINKQIQEFRSGRRSFIFECSKDPVPLVNYKEVMLYVIRCLKEDRPAHYAQYPLNEELYHQMIPEIQEKKFSIHEDQRPYYFEWTAQQLIGMEEEIVQATSDIEIQSILSKFASIYRSVENQENSPSICTAIDPNVFYLNHHYKPQIYLGIPADLIALGASIGVQVVSHPKGRLLEPFASFIKRVTCASENLETEEESLSETSLLEIKDKINLFKQIVMEDQLESENNPSSAYLERFFDSLQEIKSTIVTHVIPCAGLKQSSQSYVSEILNLIERFELEFCTHLLDLKTPDSEALFRKTLVKLGYSSTESEWKLASQERLEGYQLIKRQILNSPFFLQLLDKNSLEIDQAVQAVTSDVHVGFIKLIDHYFDQLSHAQNILGFAPEPASLIGKIRYIVSDENFEPAQPGEILVIKNASPEVHKYAAATAIISEQGGLFNHAAITFSNLKIPALLGASIEEFREYDGQLIYLKLDSRHSFFERLPDEVEPLMDAIGELSIESAEILESLPNEIGEILAQQFYGSLLQKSSAKEFSVYFHYPLAQKSLLEAKTECFQLKRSLWRSDDKIERKFLYTQLKTKLEKLREIYELNQDQASVEELDNEIIRLEQQTNHFEIDHLGFGKSGKKENLEHLQEILPSIETDRMNLFIPQFVTFDAESLIWQQFPKIKADIEIILREEKLSNEDKSKQIRAIIALIPLDSNLLLRSIGLEGDLIVRSSASLEDQCEMAAAGIFDSIPVVNGEEISEAFLKVLGSAFSERALAFFKTDEERRALFNMNLIVQKYISDGSYSGVAFSVANKEQWSTVGMQVVAGLGGGVDGTQIPTHAFIDTKGKTFVDLLIPKAQALPCSFEIMLELGQIMKQLEQKFHAPVEIEFVANGDGIAIVQLRPIVL